MNWETFFVASGVLFWLSLGAGGLWVGLCLLTDWLKRRRFERDRTLGIAGRIETPVVHGITRIRMGEARDV